MKRSKLKFAISVTALMAIGVLRAGAQPLSPAATQPSAIAHVTLGSLDELQAVADDLQLPLPPFLTAAGLEQFFPFVGAGGMRKELPVSLDYLAGGKLQAQQLVIFYLPLVAGHAPITTFIQQGQALGNDGALVNGVTFRRTGNYLIWGGVPDAVMAIPADKLPDSKPSHPLLEIIYDAKRLRQVAPEILENYRKSQLEQQTTGKSASELAGQRLAIDAITRGLDGLTFSLERKDDQFRITTQIEPSPIFVAHEYQKPGLPEGCAFRIDWQPPRDWVRKGLDACVNLIGRDEFLKNTTVDAAHQGAFKDLLVSCCNSVLDGDVATYGMELLDDGPIFYSVTQTKNARDVKSEFTDIQQRIDKPDLKHKKNTELTSYILPDGTAVTRLIGMGEDGKPQFYVDAVDRGTTRMITVSKTDVHAVDRLMNAKSVGPLTDPAAGWVDGKRTLSLIAGFGKMNASLTDEDHELLNRVLKDQRVSWTVNTNDSRLNIIFDVPVMLVKNLTQNMDGLGKVFAKMKTGK